MKTRTLKLFAITAGVLVVGALHPALAVQNDATDAYTKILRNGPATEIPAEAAKLVAQASAKDQALVAVNTVRAAVTLAPAASATIVGAIAHVAPATAPMVAGEASRLQPALATYIAKAATTAAPKYADRIAFQVCKQLPKQYRAIAIKVAEAAPGRSSQVIEAVGEAIPGLKTFLDHAAAQEAAYHQGGSTVAILNEPGVARSVIDEADFLVGQSAQKFSISEDQIILNGLTPEQKLAFDTANTDVGAGGNGKAKSKVPGVKGKKKSGEKMRSMKKEKSRMKKYKKPKKDKSDKDDDDDDP